MLLLKKENGNESENQWFFFSWSVDAGNRIWMKVSSPVSARRGTEIAQAILEKIGGRIKIGNFHRVNKQWNLILLKIICPSDYGAYW